MKYVPKYVGGSADSGFTIQHIVIKKPITLEAAKRSASSILKKDKVKPVEKADSYHVRNLPKTKFIKGSFRSKKVSPDITLVFGELRPEFMHLKGAGIWDWLKEKANSVVNYFKPKLDGFNNTSMRSLNQYGNKTISGMFIMRTPIRGMLNTALNALSFGKWNELREKYAYDKLFHLALVVEVENKKIIVEKNATVNINTNYSHASDSEIQNVPLNGKQITLFELVDRGRKSVGDTTFFKYNAFNENEGTNCQRFIQLVLQANGLLTPEADAFLMQDLSQLKEELPGYVRDTAQLATDLGAIVNKVTGGKRSNKVHSYVNRKFKSIFHN